MFGKSHNYFRPETVVAAATATTLILLSSLAGCTGANGAVGPVEQVLQSPAAGGMLGDAEDGFEGRLLQVAIEGLVTGAAEQSGGDAYGNILVLLGWGHDADAGSYKAMQTTLNNIEDGVAEIKTQLTALQTQLSITEDEIIANINDPVAAITEIETYEDDLKILSDSSKAPGTGNKETIRRFATKIEGEPGIEYSVKAIHNAIIPQDGAKKGVLDNYRKLLLDKDADLSSAYLALETYFSQLVYYQIQGVTLVVEARTAQAKDTPPIGSEVETVEYYKNFRASLAEEVQNFMDNTWCLIVAQASLAHTSGFLPAEATVVAARAEFLRTQTLALDHFGLRAHAVVTSNHKDEVTTATATAADRSTHTAKPTTTTSVKGPVYDSWKGAEVSPSFDYQVVTFDFGDLPAGSYTITGPAGFAPATVKVQTYNADYSADTAGKIRYGSALGHTRTGAVEAFAAGAGGSGSGRTWQHGGSSKVSFGGSLAADKISVSGDSASFNGEIQVDYRFTYGGSTAAKVTIPSHARVRGTLKTSIVISQDVVGSATANGTATMGVWNSHKTVSAPSKWSHDVSDNQKAPINDNAPTSFVFMAEPGHSYTVYFTAAVSGSQRDGSAAAQITVDSMAGMQIQF